MWLLRGPSRADTARRPFRLGNAPFQTLPNDLGERAVFTSGHGMELIEERLRRHNGRSFHASLCIACHNPHDGEPSARPSLWRNRASMILRSEHAMSQLRGATGNEEPVCHMTYPCATLRGS